MKSIVTVVTLLLLSTSVGYAALKTVGKAETLQFDTSNFTPEMKANYEFVKSRCVVCHSLERYVQAVNYGVTPISGQEFSAKTMSKGFGCKPNKNNKCLTKQEARPAFELTNYLLQEAAKNP